MLTLFSFVNHVYDTVWFTVILHCTACFTTVLPSNIFWTYIIAQCTFTRLILTIQHYSGYKVKPLWLLMSSVTHTPPPVPVHHDINNNKIIRCSFFPPGSLAPSVHGMDKACLMSIYMLSILAVPAFHCVLFGPCLLVLVSSSVMIIVAVANMD